MSCLQRKIVCFLCDSWDDRILARQKLMQDFGLWKWWMQWLELIFDRGNLIKTEWVFTAGIYLVIDIGKSFYWSGDKVFNFRCLCISKWCLFVKFQCNWIASLYNVFVNRHLLWLHIRHVPIKCLPFATFYWDTFVNCPSLWMRLYLLCTVLIIPHLLCFRLYIHFQKHYICRPQV